MSRPSKNQVRFNMYIEEEIYLELQKYLLDPTKGGKLRYGALSSVINTLLRQFLTTIKQPEIDPITFLRAYGVHIELEE